MLGGEKEGGGGKEGKKEGCRQERWTAVSQPYPPLGRWPAMRLLARLPLPQGDPVHGALGRWMLEQF